MRLLATILLAGLLLHAARAQESRTWEDFEASAATRGAGGLREFLARGEVPEGGSTLLFVPDRPGAWLDEVLSSIAHRRGAVHAVLGVDRLDDRRSGLLGRILMGRPRVAASRRPDVVAVAERLEAAGAAVHVVDRASGRVVEEAVVRGSVAAARPGSKRRSDHAVVR